jgi:multidrug resistance efflux pump|tara:strand:+ start:269 stop:589 length:321 start_codon:yes stop_codon:yes gene_type:complete
MCGRKRDPKIDEQLKENKAEAEAAKDTAQADLKEAKADALEQAKMDAPSEEIVTQGQLDRQGENIFDDPERKSMAALRRSRRSGGRGRRSLLTAKTGQGYFSRFGL